VSHRSLRPETLVLHWVGLYTLGLEAGTRRDRQAEISSDIWEHRDYAAGEGERPIATSISILGRWMAGVPADVSWRASHLLGSHNEKEQTMAYTKFRYWWQFLAALTAVATTYLGVRQFMTDEVEAGINAGKIGGLVLLGGAGLLTLMGLAYHRSNPRRGAAMVVVGVLPVALIGGLGLGNIVGLVSSLANGEGWWWVPVGIASAVATAAGVGAFSAWWNASPAAAHEKRPKVLVPGSLLLVGILAAGAGVGTGLIPVAVTGALIAVIGLGFLTRRVRSAA